MITSSQPPRRPRSRERGPAVARIRCIKPGFFLNETLGSLSVHARLLYIGLWCLADREGKLEDRPRWIQTQILPYDTCDVDKLLAELAKSEFIVRYKLGKRKRLRRYICIPTFLQHQRPHPREAPSTIPNPIINFHALAQPRCGPDTTKALSSPSDPGSSGSSGSSATATATADGNAAAATKEELTKRGVEPRRAEFEAGTLRPECIQDALRYFDEAIVRDRIDNHGGFLVRVLEGHRNCKHTHAIVPKPKPRRVERDQAIQARHQGRNHHAQNEPAAN